MDYHKNARTTVWSREHMVRAGDGSWKHVGGGCSRRQRERQDSRQVGKALPGGRPCRATIAHAVRTGDTDRPSSNRWSWSIRCAVSGGQACGSPGGRASVAPRSAASCAGTSSAAYAIRPPRPANRYEHPNPGDLLHLDIKKLGRIAKPGHRVTGNPADRSRRVGWEYVHVAIDDHSRIAYSAILADETAAWAAVFLAQALDYYARLGIRIRRILTDNGPAIAHVSSPAPATGSDSNTASPGPTRHVPTAKQSASSRLLSTSGHTLPVSELRAKATTTQTMAP